MTRDLFRVFESSAEDDTSFLKQVIDHDDDENPLQELTSLFIQRGIEGVRPEDIREIEQKNNLSLYRRFEGQLKILLSRYIRFCLEDRKFSAEEIDNIGRLKNLFRLSDRDVERIMNSEAADTYQQEVAGVLSDGVVDPEEEAFLRELKKNILLPEGMAKNIFREQAHVRLRKFLDGALLDERISDEEIRELEALCGNLGIRFRLDDASRNFFERCRLYWQIENGCLPEVDCSHRLHRKEHCRFASNAEWLEEKPRLLSAPSLPQLHGTSKPFLDPEALEEYPDPEKYWKDAGEGIVFITDRRLLFDGRGVHRHLRLGNILDFDVYKNGLEICVPNGKDAFVNLARNAELAALILDKVLEGYYA